MQNYFAYLPETPLAEVWLPDQGVEPYRGRG